VTGALRWGALVGISGLVTLVGCMPLPPETGGVAITAGPKHDQWVVRLDPVLGTPSSMTNRILEDTGTSADTSGITEYGAEVAIRAVVHDNSQWFRSRPDLDDVRIVRAYSRGWLHYVRVEQTYRGIPVAGAGYDARVLSNSRVGSLEGKFYPDIQTDLRPNFNADQAEERARSLFPTSTERPAGIPYMQYEYVNLFSEPRELILIPGENNVFVLAWAILVRSSPWAYSRVYVDASTGRALGVEYSGSIDPRNR